MATKECIQLKGNGYWEVDVYKEQLKDLVVAEIEFPEEIYQETIAMSLPEWIRKDITDDFRYKNSQLALSTPELIQILV
jgi:CYTH domain-containing protein